MGFKAIVTDPIDNEGIEILKTVANVDIKTEFTEDELCELLPNYDAWIVRSATQVTRKALQAAKKLKVVARAGVGVDNVDVTAATEKGIYVVNSPYGNVIAAAELTIGLILSIARRIPQADASIRRGEWKRSKFVGEQLCQKKLGIAGLGQVGCHVAKIARGLGMQVLAYDPYVNHSKAEQHHCRLVPLDVLLAESDFVTLHVPKMVETIKLINSDRLRQMKPTAYLINVSRGGVVDEGALVNAIDQGVIAGAALDVFEVEKAFPPSHPLLKSDNILLTPHLGASTGEAQKLVAVDVADQVVTVLNGGLPRSAINAQLTMGDDVDSVLEVIRCCERIGRIAAQMLGEPLEKVEVTVLGQFASFPPTTLLLSAANGAIGAHTESRVNYTNVQQLAESHQIRLAVSTESHKPSSGVHVVVSGKSQTVSCIGSTLEDGRSVLTSIQGTPVFLVIPNEPLIYLEIIDQPQTMADITGALGRSEVNIANCHLGRKRTHADRPLTAVAIFHVDWLDSAVAESTRESLIALDVVKSCVVLQPPSP